MDEDFITESNPRDDVPVAFSAELSSRHCGNNQTGKTYFMQKNGVGENGDTVSNTQEIKLDKPHEDDDVIVETVSSQGNMAHCSSTDQTPIVIQDFEQSVNSQIINEDSFISETSCAESNVSSCVSAESRGSDSESDSDSSTVYFTNSSSEGDYECNALESLVGVPDHNQQDAADKVLTCGTEDEEIVKLLSEMVQTQDLSNPQYSPQATDEIKDDSRTPQEISLATDEIKNDSPKQISDLNLSDSSCDMTAKILEAFPQEQPCQVISDLTPSHLNKDLTRERTSLSDGYDQNLDISSTTSASSSFDSPESDSDTSGELSYIKPYNVPSDTLNEILGSFPSDECIFVTDETLKNELTEECNNVVKLTTSLKDSSSSIGLEDMSELTKAEKQIMTEDMLEIAKPEEQGMTDIMSELTKAEKQVMTDDMSELTKPEKQVMIEDMLEIVNPERQGIEREEQKMSQREVSEKNVQSDNKSITNQSTVKSEGMTSKGLPPPVAKKIKRSHRVSRSSTWHERYLSKDGKMKLMIAPDKQYLPKKTQFTSSEADISHYSPDTCAKFGPENMGFSQKLAQFERISVMQVEDDDRIRTRSAPGRVNEIGKDRMEGDCGVRNDHEKHKEFVCSLDINNASQDMIQKENYKLSRSNSSKQSLNTESSESLSQSSDQSFSPSPLSTSPQRSLTPDLESYDIIDANNEHGVFNHQSSQDSYNSSISVIDSIEVERFQETSLTESGKNELISNLNILTVCSDCRERTESLSHDDNTSDTTLENSIVLSHSGSLDQGHAESDTLVIQALCDSLSSKLDPGDILHNHNDSENKLTPLIPPADHQLCELDSSETNVVLNDQDSNNVLPSEDISVVVQNNNENTTATEGVHLEGDQVEFINQTGATCIMVHGKPSCMDTGDDVLITENACNKDEAVSDAGINLVVNEDVAADTRSAGLMDDVNLAFHDEKSNKGKVDISDDVFKSPDEEKIEIDAKSDSAVAVDEEDVNHDNSDDIQSLSGLTNMTVTKRMDKSCGQEERLSVIKTDDEKSEKNKSDGFERKNRKKRLSTSRRRSASLGGDDSDQALFPEPVSVEIDQEEIVSVTKEDIEETGEQGVSTDEVSAASGVAMREKSLERGIIPSTIMEEGDDIAAKLAQERKSFSKSLTSIPSTCDNQEEESPKPAARKKRQPRQTRPVTMAIHVDSSIEAKGIKKPNNSQRTKSGTWAKLNPISKTKFNPEELLTEAVTLDITEGIPPMFPNFPTDKRSHTALEIFTTERSYVRGLETLIQLFMNPLSKILDENEMQTLFSNVTDIFAVNKDILYLMYEKLHHWHSTQLIGDVFINNFHRLKIYATFLNNFDNAEQFIKSKTKKSSSFEETLNFCYSHPACQFGQTLPSYLITVVQRIPRYILLLKDLKKRTPDNHPDRGNLSKAKKEIKKIAAFIDNQLQESVGKKAMVELRSQVIGLKAFETKGRTLLKEGVLNFVGTSKPYKCLLFNDLFVFARKGKARHEVEYVFELNTLWFADLKDIDPQTVTQNSFELYTPNQPYTVYAKNNSEKRLWLQKLRVAFVNHIHGPDAPDDADVSYRRTTFNYKDGRIYSGDYVDAKQHGKGTMWWPNQAKYEGEWQDEERNGVGDFHYTTGEVYKGQWLDNIQHGYGEMHYPGNNVYKGWWKAGKMHGEGTILFHNHDTFEGVFVSGEIEGIGRLECANRLVYDGEWKRSKKHGQGEMWIPNGENELDYYKGSFKDDVREGHGEMQYSDGSVYIGSWRDGRRHGHGVWTCPDCTRYEGDWSMDHKTGKGKLEYSSGDVYDGLLFENKRQGKGILMFKNGCTYIGEFDEDLINGEGIMDYDDGSQYAGHWTNNLRDGKGKMSYANGDIYDGGWKLDLRCGHGKIVFSNGVVYSGGWLSDKEDGEGVYHDPHIEYNYQGLWRLGLKEGYGTEAFGHDRYEGHWRSNMRHGSGTETLASGVVFRGTWIENKKCGPGVRTLRNEVEENQIWKNGQLVDNVEFVPMDLPLLTRR